MQENDLVKLIGHHPSWPEEWNKTLPIGTLFHVERINDHWVTVKALTKKYTPNGTYDDSFSIGEKYLEKFDES